MDPSTLDLHPIFRSRGENSRYSGNPDCIEMLDFSLTFYEKAGYQPPWICYFAECEGVPVGMAAFKGAPQGGKVEIAYGTFEPFQKQGMASAMCGLLIRIARETDPSVRIVANTAPENNASVRILEKHGFLRDGWDMDDEIGAVWHWELPQPN